MYINIMEYLADSVIGSGKETFWMLIVIIWQFHCLCLNLSLLFNIRE